MTWITLGNTTVRVEDIYRIELKTSFGLIYWVYLTQGGEPIRIEQGKTGWEWLYNQCEAGVNLARKADADRKKLQEEEDNGRIEEEE